MMHIILTRNHVSPHPSHLISCCACRMKSKTRFAPHCYPCQHPCNHAHPSMLYPYQTLAHSMATMLPITPAYIPAQCLCSLHRMLPPAIRETKIAVRWWLPMRHSVPQHLVRWDSSQLPCGLNRYLSGRIISTGRDSRATYCATRLCSIEC